MIFDKLILKNFQSHVETEIDLSKNVNCIIGETNNGKSSIVRAIHFFYTNTWSSDFLRHGEENAEITLENEFVSIKRVKGKDNYFEVKMNGKTEIYDKLGRSNIPIEIQNLLEIDSDLFFNIARQNPMDLDFLMTDTSSSRSSQLSVILKLDKIEDAIISVRTDINKTRKDYNSTEKIIEDLTLEKEKMDWIEDLDEIVKSSKENTRDILKNIESYNSLSMKQDRLEKISIQVRDSKKELDFLPQIDKSNLDMIEEKISKLYNIKKIYEKHISVSDKISQIESELEKYKNIKFDDLEIIDEKVIQISNQKKILSKFEKVKETTLDVSEKIKSIDVENKKLQKELESCIDEMEVCPICFSAPTPLSEKDKELILENL